MARLPALRLPVFAFIVCILCACVSCATGSQKAQPSSLEGTVWHFANDDGSIDLSFGKDGIISLYASTQASSGLFLDLGEGLYLLSFGGDTVDAVRITYDMFSFLGMIFVQQAGSKNAVLTGTRWTSAQEAAQHTLSFNSESVLWICTTELDGVYTDTEGGVLSCTFDTIGTVEARVMGDTLIMGDFTFTKQQPQPQP
ncbi:MAG: hypothetical protein LBB43_06645 [Spirochaetaceae bacterium]|nr:hypothetical protein [Spirochaetaceae bacterium]